MRHRSGGQVSERIALHRLLCRSSESPALDGAYRSGMTPSGQARGMNKPSPGCTAAFRRGAVATSAGVLAPRAVGTPYSGGERAGGSSLLGGSRKIGIAVEEAAYAQRCQHTVDVGAVLGATGGQNQPQLPCAGPHQPT